MRISFLILCFISFCSWVKAQEPLSSLRQKTISTKGVVKLDSLSIVPGSVFIATFDTTFYRINYIQSELIWLRNTSVEQVQIQYRVFPFALAQKFSLYKSDSSFLKFTQNPKKNSERLTSDEFNSEGIGKLNYTGSLGRSLSIGNAQNAVLNAQLNLQLSGFIGDSIEVTGALTDNNLPIQPDGSTQQLNEFDRVWLQFKKGHWQLNLGDLDFRTSLTTYFGFYKRLQGATFQFKHNKNQNQLASTTFGAAIAKGKFFRNIINGVEGNQGPYKLTGANNEIFFIVLAGTERVFIDGVMMQRGEDQDYVINYNTAEITFTPRQMISKDKRIQVEFEYADRNYLNSMVMATHENQISNKIKLVAGFYSNTDNRNTTVNQTLNTEQRLFLSTIGDQVQNAFYPSITKENYSVDKILYKKIPSPINSSDSIYQYSTHPDSAKFSLSFTEVGYQKGNYIIAAGSANGRVFQWVAPQNGIPQGNYEPVLYLATPKQQQIFTIGAEVGLHLQHQLQFEMALSKFDLNRLSSKDKNNDAGSAGKIQYKFSTPKGNLLKVNSALEVEWVSQHFRPIERIRSVEFYREWGLDFLPNFTSEFLPKLNLQIIDSKNNSFQFQNTYYQRGDGYSGLQTKINHLNKIKNLQIQSALQYTKYATKQSDGYFLKPNIGFSAPLKFLKNAEFGMQYQLEHHQHQTANKAMLPNSFSFDVKTIYLKSNPSAINQWWMNYYSRKDRLPTNTSLLEADKSNNLQLGYQFWSNAQHQFKGSFTFRSLEILNQQVTLNKQTESILTRLDYSWSILKNALTGNMLYEIGNGQEPRRNIFYYEVPVGRGEYAWIDYNNDGIQQLNEFEKALYPDQAKYIRLFAATNEYLVANYNQLNYNLVFSPKTILRQSSAVWNKVVSALILQSSLQHFQKQTNSPTLYNPFATAYSDTSLVHLSSVFSNILSINRLNKKWGVDISKVQSENKSLLNYGLETFLHREMKYKARFAISNFYLIEYVYRKNSDQLLTPSFNNRNYSIVTILAEPKISYIHSTKWRWSLAYQLIDKTNAVQFGGEQAKTSNWLAEAQLNWTNKAVINAKIQRSEINYQGKINSTVSYVLLDGLLPGKNWLWNVDVTKRLANQFELVVQYEGRKPSSTSIIHLGRVSVRALF